jgi:hypothetical protein
MESSPPILLRIAPLDGLPEVIRTDPTPGFQSIANNNLIISYRLYIELGKTKTVNKNPVVDRAMQEVNEHILRLDACAKAISPVMLARAIASVNSVLCSSGLYSREMLTHSDHFTKSQLLVSDRSLLSQKHLLRFF